MNIKQMIKMGMLGGGNVQSYVDLTKSIDLTSLLVFYPLNEISGTTAINAEGTGARNATYSNITLNSDTSPFGEGSPTFNGLTSAVDIYSASLASAFNNNTFSLNLWFKRNPLDSAVRTLTNIGVNASNLISVLQINSSTVRVRYLYVGTARDVNITTSSDAWNMYTMTYSIPANEMKVSFNGSQYGSTLTTLSAWSEGISAGRCYIGVSDSTLNAPGKGSCAYYSFWNKALTQTEITTLYNNGPTF